MTSFLWYSVRIDQKNFIVQYHSDGAEEDGGAGEKGDLEFRNARAIQFQS